jgi:hypothetical protein
VKISEQFPSKYLKASDLAGKEPQLKIGSVCQEEVGQEREKKMVVYFEGKQRGMVLNRTNAERLSHKFGDDTDGWAGQSVQLYSEVVHFQGKTVDGLRVRPVAAAPAKQDLNDAIPF